MAIYDDKGRITSLAPANGGRGPGGAFAPIVKRPPDAISSAGFDNTNPGGSDAVRSLAPTNGGRGPGGAFDPKWLVKRQSDQIASNSFDPAQPAGAGSTPYHLSKAPGLVRARESARVADNFDGPTAPAPAPGPVMHGQPVPGYGAANLTRPGPVPIGFDGNRAADRAATMDPNFIRPERGRWSIENLDPNQPKVLRAPVAGAIPGNVAPALAAPKPPPTIANPAASVPPVQQLPTQTVTPDASPAATPAGALARAPQSAPGLGIQNTRIPGISEVTGNPDGSRTFTDRPDGTLAALAANGTMRNPSAFPQSERDAYLATVPTLGSGAGITRPNVSNGGGGGISPGLAARFAQSDAIAVANEDPRSAAGSAARNARLRRDYAGPQTRTQREGSARAYEQTIAGLVNPGAGLQQGANEMVRTQAQEVGANQRAMIGADASLQQARITRPRDAFQQVTLEDGTLAQVGENGLSRPVVGADGKPVRPQRGREPTDQTAYSKMYESNLNRLLGADPLTGMISDPANPKQSRQPTAQELSQATNAARDLTMQALGGSQDGQILVDAEGNRARLVNGQYVPVE